MADGEFPGAELGKERMGSDATFPGVDTLGALGIGEDSDQAFEPEVRRGVWLEDCGEISAEDAADAVAVAKPFGFIAAGIASHKGGDAGAVTADVLAAAVFAGEEAGVAAGGAGAAGVSGCGEADPADGTVWPMHSNLRDLAAAAVAAHGAWGAGSSAGSVLSRHRRGFARGRVCKHRRS